MIMIAIITTTILKHCYFFLVINCVSIIVNTIMLKIVLQLIIVQVVNYLIN